jgi:hypothetical protein
MRHAPQERIVRREIAQDVRQGDPRSPWPH